MKGLANNIMEKGLAKGVKMFYPEARGDCRLEDCVDWHKEGCLRRRALMETIARAEQLGEIAKMQQAFWAQQEVFANILFDDIENSDAPEAVKDYIRQYRDSEAAKKLIKELEE